jgi:hypothetical protein
MLQNRMSLASAVGYSGVYAESGRGILAPALARGAERDFRECPLTGHYADITSPTSRNRRGFLSIPGTVSGWVGNLVESRTAGRVTANMAA